MVRPRHGRAKAARSIQDNQANFAITSRIPAGGSTTEIDRIETIQIPPKGFRLRPNHRGFPFREYRVLAFDTETVNGWPYTLQVTDGEHTHLWYLEPKEFLPKLVAWLRPYTRHRADVVLWGHYLPFDLAAVCYPFVSKLTEGVYTRRVSGIDCEFYYGKIPFARFRFPGNRTVWVIDTFAFVWTSLKKAAAMWGLPVQKHKRPAGLGRIVLKGPEFEAYAKADVETTWHLGDRLIDLHRSWDLTVCVSIAQMAGRIFAHHFLKEPLPPLPDEVMQLALQSYHGGKNGLYVKPGWHWCREYDLKSAYPWAMTKIPPMARGRWEKVSYVDSRHEGFYRIRGRTNGTCRYPAVFSSTFLPLVGGFDGVSITSFELREGVRSGCIALDAVSGYVWRPAKAATDRPLRRFARHFFRAKETAEPGPEREMFKLILNSLYGKFIQLTEMPDGTEKPGQYFHPVLASWITGCVRARMHRLECQSRALHSATDAIHTRTRLHTGHGLGDLEEAVPWGPCLFLRNKFYFHYSADGNKLKEAHHGVQTHPTTIWKLLLQGKRTYRVRRLLRVRESVRLRTRPLQEIYRTHKMNLDGVVVHPVPAPAQRYWNAKGR